VAALFASTACLELRDPGADMTDSASSTAFAAEPLRGVLGGRVLLPGDAGFDEARQAWNTAIDQRPAAVAVPRSTEEVSEVVRAASQAGLRIAVQATGHAAEALAGRSLDDVLLINLRDLTGVGIDEKARRARVAGGTSWREVVEAAAAHGLTALHGSAGDVSAVGYSLQGGLSFYARRHGLAINAVRAIEVVLPDGSIRRASAEEDPELWWALRGGVDLLGIVTAVELELLPYPDVVAGMLLWDAGHATAVVTAWRDWAATAPDSSTTSLRVMHFPPLPELPPFLAGRSIVVIDGAILGDDEDAARVLAPLRALGPEIDSFARIPASALLEIHMDPPVPTPNVSAHSILGSLLDAAVLRFVGAASRESGLMFAELRQLGGAIATAPEGAGAIGAVAGEFALFAVAMTPTQDAVLAGREAVAGPLRALDEWTIDARLLNFCEGSEGRKLALGEATGRLARIAHQVDPGGRMLNRAASS